MIGFILLSENYETKVFKKEREEKGHIEIAVRTIREIGAESRYKKSKWGKMDNPVDYLVYEEGAIKLGTRWEDRVVTYCPNSMSKKLYPVVREYIMRSYRVDEVFDPTISTLTKFHI